MGMSTHVVGFRPPDEKWKAMKAIWDACKTAKVAIPKEVDTFFDGMPPDERGISVSIEKATKEYRSDMKEGFEVDITKLPKDLTVIRFVNSW